MDNTYLHQIAPVLAMPSTVARKRIRLTVSANTAIATRAQLQIKRELLFRVANKGIIMGMIEKMRYPNLIPPEPIDINARKIVRKRYLDTFIFFIEFVNSQALAGKIIV